MKLISACLFGLPCRYDGGSKPDRALCEAVEGEALLIVCPEQLGGLPTPRPPAQLDGGDGCAVLAGKATVRRISSGEDVSDSFRKGADRTAALAQACGVTQAILKSKSPSCGVHQHYRGGVLRDGMGVAAAALHAVGIPLEERG